MVDIKSFDNFEEIVFANVKSHDGIKLKSTEWFNKDRSASAVSMKSIHLRSAKLLKTAKEKESFKVNPFTTPQKADKCMNRNSKEIFQYLHDKSTTAEFDRISRRIKSATSSRDFLHNKARSSFYTPDVLVKEIEDFTEVKKKIDTFTNVTNHLPKLTSEEGVKILNIFRKGQNSEFYKIKNRTFNNRKSADFELYTIFKKKKPLKNFPKKKQLYNLDPEKILHHEYKPLKEFVTKNLKYTKDAVEREIKHEFSKPFMIVDESKFSKRFRVSNEVIEHEKRMDLRSQVKANEEKKHIEKLENIFTDYTLIKGKINIKIERKKIIYAKVKKCIIKASMNFRRLKISLDDYFGKHLVPSKPLQHPNAERFFLYVKMDDRPNITALLNDNKFLIYEYDYVITALITSLIRHVCIGLLNAIIFH
jgi:hypothetical protein